MGTGIEPPTPTQQRSIASFFKPKTVNGLGASKRPETQSSPTTVDADSTNIYDAESDDEALTSRLPSRSPKRPLAEDPDAINNGLERSNKRTRGDDGSSLVIPEKQTSQPGSSTTGPAGLKNPKSSQRTERYIYNGTKQSAAGSATVQNEDWDVELTRSQKEELHRKFVRKLGHPDSIAQIKRRNWQITEEAEQLDEEDGEGDEEETPGASKGKRKGAKTGKLTPMELQMLEIKRKNMDAILIVEVGYKFKFFGEDARIAAKELGIVCIPGKFRFDEHPSEAHLDRFASASIPVHRLPVHVKRLVVAGHKVGVVRQIETAALKKAGDNRNTPFIRKLTNLYTKSTYIDDIEGLDQPTNAPTDEAQESGYLLCITESNSKGLGTDEKVDVGILAVQPTTGDVIYDNFEDGFMRSEIETRLLHISPCEFLIVGDLTKATDKLIKHLSGSTSNVFGDRIRMERVGKSKNMAAQSYTHVAQFYAGKMKAYGDSDNEQASDLLDKVLNLSQLVTICLSAMITHMTEYGLEHVFDLTKYFQSFSTRSHMLLNGNTLTSLELFRNQTNGTQRGTMFWALDKTKTRFGRRLLRKWASRPLLDKQRLEERVAAVEELNEKNQSINVDKLRSLLMKVKSDLEQSLIRIYYGKCTRPELLTVLQTMQRIANEFAHIRSPGEADFKSSIINEAIAALPVIGDLVVSFLDKINPAAARSDDKYSFFRENEEGDDISNYKLGIASVEQDLEEHRPIAAEKIRKKIVTYVKVAGIEYLIEVSNTDLKHVPASWAKISGTKKLSRFHTPEVIRMIRERDRYKESLAAACDVAFANLLSKIASHYQSFRDCVSSLATLDCLLSLATVAAQPGYVKPEYTDTNEITIVEGRHPVVEQLLISDYIPNNTSLSSTGTRALLITGPNMGGKSSYVRQVALICIMAQIGSYVPAASARLGMLDAVFTRMGAFDKMISGKSTFMVELSETSNILKRATPRSLVILDELGRGTSTHDGVAIAHAVLEHVVRDIKCLTLFITHYQALASVARGFPNSTLRNVHMQFVEGDGSGKGDDGEQDITFLFQVGDGVAHRSYGLNVARLAHVPRPVLELAAVKSRELEEQVRAKRVGGLARMVAGLAGGTDGRVDGTRRGMADALEQLIVGIEEL